MEPKKISEGIQYVISLLENYPVRVMDLEIGGGILYTAYKNLKILKEACEKAERNAEAAMQKTSEEAKEGASE